MCSFENLRFLNICQKCSFETILMFLNILDKYVLKTNTFANCLPAPGDQWNSSAGAAASAHLKTYKKTKV